LNGDVGHVHRVIDVGDILNWRNDVIAQNRLTDVTNLAKVVVRRADIELNIHLRTNKPSLINDAWAARRQRRPANIITTGSPGNPCWAPVQIASRKPDPPVIREIRPAAIVISSPAEILVRDPSPSIICVSPVTVSVRSPIEIVCRYVRLPAVSVPFDLDPVSAGKIIIKVIYGYFLSPRLLKKSKSTKNKRC
jgi:hypothetical protein